MIDYEIYELFTVWNTASNRPVITPVANRQLANREANRYEQLSGIKHIVVPTYLRVPLAKQSAA